MNSKGTSYLLWLMILFGLGGIHRFYNGKMLSGFLWLVTGGLFGIGQLVDLFLIPDMVETHNLKRAARLGSPYAPGRPVISRTVEKPQPKLTAAQLEVKLLRAAQARNGKLSVSQGVIDTGEDFAAVEAVLLGIAKKGHADIENDAKTGAVMYVFPELHG